MESAGNHPGRYLRDEVLPKGLSVTAAAKQLGVGRPALSNLLNGNASLSSEMAMRFEKSFGVSSEKLLSMQAAHDQSLAREREPEIAVRTYAPNFRNIKARQIEAWASDRIEARAELPALLRRLVNSTGKGLSKVDFPAFDNSQRKGWDGHVVSESATPWIPLGTSGWEFGTNDNPAHKAEGYYAGRTKNTKASIRKETTFVFVTPHNWHGKEAWAGAKKATGEWKDVRAYDASDIEQWLEDSIPGQAWMAERLNVGGADVLSLEESWRRWSTVTEPTLSMELFKGVSDERADVVAKWLTQAPDRPLTIVSDSEDESLAALAAAFQSEALRKSGAGDRVIVVKSAEALAKVASASSEFIVVMASAEAERDSAGIHRARHTIIVTRRNALEGEPDLSSDLVEYQKFGEALAGMGLDGDTIDHLRHESGHSLTVLRRRLSQIPAIRTPRWAEQTDLANRLIPLIFVGAWDSRSEADQAVLSEIAAGTHDEIERTVGELVREEDSPAWSIGHIRGVVSKVDAIYAVRSLVTADDLKRFFKLTRVVLSESDPALELPQDKRWAANIYGKSRRHSAILRQGLCETLVMLSVHGDNLFKQRLGFSVERSVNQLIRDLLTPLDPATWQSQQHDLPRYAEAAPTTLLDILEDDLRAAKPKVHALMEPVGEGFFSSPGRTGLLWALEVLAWKPEWLPRVVLILAKLAETKVNDNWANKPENSLDSIFRCWMPQTAANIDQRIEALELLVKRSPEIGWKLCLSQFDISHTIGHYNSKPRWRTYARGAGEPVKTNRELFLMGRKALDIALAWPALDEKKLGDLVEHLNGMTPEDHETVWRAVETWAATNPGEAKKAELRERIRKSTMTRVRRKKGEVRKVIVRAKEVYESLGPSDPVYRHQWLFAQQWVQESADEMADDDHDFKKRDERITKHREDALKEIWAAEGFAGIERLCSLSEAPGIVGWHLAAGVFDAKQSEEFARRIASANGDKSSLQMDRSVSGLLAKLDVTVRNKILSDAIGGGDKGTALDQPSVLRLLDFSPFGEETWAFVDQLKPDAQTRYWKEVSPSRVFRESAEVMNRIVDEFLRVDRPRAAFNTVEMEFDKIESNKLVRLLAECGTNNSEPTGHYRLASHDISDAFKELTKRSDISRDELARLEFLYIDALDHTEHGIQNLERQLGVSPELFIQALAFAFKRRDGGEDPPELRPSNAEAASGLASAAYQLLSHTKRIPGTNDEGVIVVSKLREWISRARELAREYSREEIGDSIIGQILGRGPDGADGIWPCEAIREVLEDLGTAEIASGMTTGLFNARGAVWRGKGGAQERAIAEKHRAGSLALASRFPFTSRLLDGVAKMYEHDADWHDTEDKVRERLQN